jgi:MinD-like ATPase involved in chromosome partitioning or flagellar assembly
MKIVADAAKEHDSALLVTCSDPEGLFRFLVNPDGTVSEAPYAAPVAPVVANPDPAGYNLNPTPSETASPEPQPPAQPANPVGTISVPAYAAVTGAGTEAATAPVESEPSPQIPEPPTVEAPFDGESDQSGSQPQVEEATSLAPPPPPPVIEQPLAARSAPAPSWPSPAPRETAPAPRRAFIEPTDIKAPAERGWRGALARRGITLPPSEAELADRAYRATVARQWSGPRTIAVVNGKGGAGKTPTTICLAAIFARYGGAGVLAWDNNQTRGTLGWRTEQGPHTATLLDLLPQTPNLLGTEAHGADLAPYVHHQTRDLYDVLRSKSIVLADEQRITPADVDAIWRVAAKYYRLIIMDSGNDESDPMWRRMIDHTDQLVTVTTTRADHAEAGALLVEALMQRDERSAQLARNSVTIITQADPKASEESIRRIREGYSSLSRAVVSIPYDPGMVEGTLLYDGLKPATQRAWLMAAATVAEGFAHIPDPIATS